MISVLVLASRWFLLYAPLDIFFRAEQSSGSQFRCFLNRSGLQTESSAVKTLVKRRCREVLFTPVWNRGLSEFHDNIRESGCESISHFKFSLTKNLWSFMRLPDGFPDPERLDGQTEFNFLRFFTCSSFCLLIVAFIAHFMPDDIKIALLSVTLNCIPHALHAWKLLYKYRLFLFFFVRNSSRSSSIFTAPCFCVSLCRYDDGDAHQRPARLRARHPGKGREVDAL